MATVRGRMLVGYGRDGWAFALQWRMPVALEVFGLTALAQLVGEMNTARTLSHPGNNVPSTR